MKNDKNLLYDSKMALPSSFSNRAGIRGGRGRASGAENLKQTGPGILCRGREFRPFRTGQAAAGWGP